MRWDSAAAESAAGVVQGAILVTISLLLILVTNAAARELTTNYPAGEVLFVRFLGAAVVAVAVSAGRWRRTIETRRAGMHLMRSFFAVAAAAALYLSLHHLPFADLTAISYASPLFVALLSWPLLGERIGPKRLLLIGLGFAGVLLVAFPGTVTLWSFGALAMAALNAGSLIAARSLGRTDSGAAMSFYFGVYGTLMTAPLLLLDAKLPNIDDIAMFAFVGLGAGLSIRCHVEAFRRAAASVLAPIDYLAVIAAPMLGWMFWAESPAASLAVAGAIISLVASCNCRRRGGALARRGNSHAPIGPTRLTDW